MNSTCRFASSISNEETSWQTEQIYLADGSEYTVHIPRTVLQCPCTISVAIAKTHDCCCVTLALKNMIMGTIRKEDRGKMHGFRSHNQRQLPDEAQRINVNLIRLARHLIPDIGFVDGTVGCRKTDPEEPMPSSFSCSGTTLPLKRCCGNLDRDGHRHFRIYGPSFRCGAIPGLRSPLRSAE